MTLYASRTAERPDPDATRLDPFQAIAQSLVEDWERARQSLRWAEQQGWLSWRVNVLPEIGPETVRHEAARRNSATAGTRAGFSPSPGLAQLIDEMHYQLAPGEAYYSVVREPTVHGPATLLMRVRLYDPLKPDNILSLHFSASGVEPSIDPSAVGVADLDPLFYGLQKHNGARDFAAYSLDRFIEPQLQQ